MTNKTEKNGSGISRIQSVPNWEKLIPHFVSVLRNPETGENDVVTITGELVRLAIYADTMSENLTTPPNPSFYGTRAAGL